MENKSWLWKKKSSEKALDTSEIVRKYLKDTRHEDLRPGKDAGADSSITSLDRKSAPTECDCSAKDDLLSINAKMAEEAIAAREVAEAEVSALKRELAGASDVRVAAEERLVSLESQLKVCMEQLCSLRKGQDEKIQEAVANKSRGYEGKQKFLEEKFVAACRKADALAKENTLMSTGLLEKQKLIDDLQKNILQSESEFNVLMATVDSTEKENSILRYEFRMLEKELEVRNEEREYCRALAEVLQKQQLESVKKITKLESECTRLNTLLRKRLPPVVLTKMKGEVEIGRRRKPSPPNGALITRNTTYENAHEIPSKKIAILFERLCDLEGENISLKALASQKDGELQDHRIMISRLSSKLAEAEAQFCNISSADKDSLELAKSSPMSNRVSLSSGLEAGNDDRVSESSLWSDGLNADQDRNKLKSYGEYQMLGVPDMNLMDDFVEMEKLAMVSIDLSAKFTGKELVPVSQDEFSFSETSSADTSSRRSHDWLQDVLKSITEEHRVSRRSIAELLVDINIVFGHSNHAGHAKIGKAATTSHWNASDGATSLALLHVAHNDNMSNSIHYIIDLIEGICPNAVTTVRSPPENEILADYKRVFQWRGSELNDILKHFIQTCNDLLSGKAGPEGFVQVVAVALNWIISNSRPHQDASSVRDKIKKQIGRDSLPPESGLNGPGICPLSEGRKDSNDMQHARSSLPVEASGPKIELKGIERARKSLDGKLHSVRSDAKNNDFKHQPCESEKLLEQLQIELETLRISKGMVEDQMETQKSVNEDLATQLAVANDKLFELSQSYSSLEMELETKSSSCEQLEATCLDLQLQLESSDGKAFLEPARTGWELTTTSVKLSECQETILNLGKQMKALSLSRETAIMNKVLSSSFKSKNQNKRFSLRDQLLADSNNTKDEAQKSVNYQEGKQQALALVPSNTARHVMPSAILPDSPQTYLSPKDRSGPLAIVPGKKNSGGGLFRRLLMRKKKWNSGKTSLTFGVV